MRIVITINHERYGVMLSVSVVQYRNLQKRLFAKNNDYQDRYLKKIANTPTQISIVAYTLYYYGLSKKLILSILAPKFDEFKVF